MSHRQPRAGLDAIEVRIGRRAHDLPTVQPLPPGSARPGFAGGKEEVGCIDGRWLVTLGDKAEAAGALAAARMPPAAAWAADLRGLDPAQAAAFATGLWLRADSHPRRPADAPARLRTLRLQTDHPAALRRAWAAAEPALLGVAFARRLVAEPSNHLTPAGFIAALAPLARAGVSIEVLHRKALRRAGLGGLLAVGGGSVHKPALVVLRWPGRIAADPVVFVGKGITFDTGGLCIKPAKGMEEMRADMAGAAACAGAMLALALRRAHAPAAAVLALAENATSGSAYRPGDVLRLADGTTVEVVDTDAEGRLVLADALAYARQHLRPAALVDLATLTGAIVTALGGEQAGLFDNDPALATQVAAAGAAVDEPAWRMPIGGRHREDLRSAIADLRHCVPGRGQPDACHAAAFLREFVGDTPWAHLDIAGMELHDEADDHSPAGATGFGVRLLDRLVAQSFDTAHR